VSVKDPSLAAVICKKFIDSMALEEPEDVLGLLLAGPGSKRRKGVDKINSLNKPKRFSDMERLVKLGMLLRHSLSICTPYCSTYRTSGISTKHGASD
jgi:hypothetical protein